MTLDIHFRKITSGALESEKMVKGKINLVHTKMYRAIWGGTGYRGRYFSRTF